MLLKIAWRNIWRNKVRSLVVLVSIALGILAGLLVMALSVGMNNTRTRDAINAYISHVQIHTEAYKEDKKVDHYIPEPQKVENTLQADPMVSRYSMRTLTNGMASSANSIQGVLIQGIDPAAEAEVTSIHQKIIDGNYFEKTRRNPIVIGSKLAEKLKIRHNSKVVLTFQNTANEIVAAAFRVNGIFKSANSKFDESVVFVDRDDLQELLGQENIIHEIAVMTHDLDNAGLLQQQLKEKFPHLLAEDWKTLSPDLGYADEMMATTLYIFIGIILLAMAFGILNTMLMAVLERTRELGMLMAIGMNKTRVFLMVLYETVMLAWVAGLAGLLLSFWLIDLLGERGIDLSMWSKGMAAYGISSIVYPELENPIYFTVALMVVVMAILSAIYPAFKAVRLKPTESMRTV